ncbi:hypothetical protein RhiirB3_392912 [Rhizophagus irregularis]|nr:hypothetical protein RhiirB3_392912 [Rhizophagus irregularis]
MKYENKEFIASKLPFKTVASGLFWIVGHYFQASEKNFSSRRFQDSGTIGGYSKKEMVLNNLLGDIEKNEPMDQVLGFWVCSWVIRWFQCGEYTPDIKDNSVRIKRNIGLLKFFRYHITFTC